jgi:hypothetical protein
VSGSFGLYGHIVVVWAFSVLYLLRLMLLFAVHVMRCQIRASSIGKSEDLFRVECPT